MQDSNHSHRVTGIHYQEFLTQLHDRLKPKTYLEIGVQHGNTLRLAKCASIAVDPDFKCNQDVILQKPECHFFQKTSDDFFAHHDPSIILGGRAVELAFLDGLHWFEALLRDFMNTERFCNSNSVILLHDCLPPGFNMTTRDINAIDDPSDPENRFPHWWAGDVWKIVPTLQKYRPDLKLSLLDCTPTGIVMISNLDSADTILKSRYAEIVSVYENHGRREYDLFWRDADIQSWKTVLPQKTEKGSRLSKMVSALFKS